MSSQELVPQKIVSTFGQTELSRTSERETAAVQAREEAMIKAEYVMAERHPRVWHNVRAAILDHCERTRFAEISRYAKPVGKKFVNGEWIEEKARGWTARFAETLRQEMGNIKPVSQVTFEDDLIRIVRFGVIDLQKNIPRYREVTFAKTVEKRGKKIKGKSGAADTFEPPEGREVISQRINSYGEPTYLVRATDDEMRNKVNSEESKTQRDFTLALCPRDILEDCLDRVEETMAKDVAADPTRAMKRLIDGLHKAFGLMPTDLENYIGKPVSQFTARDAEDLRELGNAIRDGQTTFQESLRSRYTQPEDGETETREQAAARKIRQMEEQKEAAMQMEQHESRTTDASVKPARKSKRDGFIAELQSMSAANPLAFANKLGVLGFEESDLLTATDSVLADIVIKIKADS